jgi:hypothetical protein
MRVRRLLLFAGIALLAGSSFAVASESVASARPRIPGQAWVPHSFWQVDSNGHVYESRSDSPTANGHLSKPVVGMVSTPSGNGYWVVGADGGVSGFGAAAFHGSLPGHGVTPQRPIVAMASTPSGKGYWLVGADGGVFSFGDAAFHGSLPGLGVIPERPIVGMASTPSGKGYWLVGADGGVFSFGDATFHGSLAGTALDAAIVGIHPTRTGSGYWLDGSDGGVFTFGNAGFFGSTPGIAGSVVGAVFPTPDQRGYWLVTSSTAGRIGEGFGDVLTCWGDTDRAYVAGFNPPVVVGAAAVGGVNDVGDACTD